MVCTVFTRLIWGFMKVKEGTIKDWEMFSEEISGDLPVLFEAIGSGFFVVNRQLEVLFINSHGRKIFQNFTKDDNVELLLEVRQLSTLKQMVLDVFACGESKQRVEFVIQESDKRLRWIGISLSLYANEFVLAFFRELTEIKFDEHKRNQDVNLRSISYLATGVAHEFNNLFAALMGYYELFLENESYKERFFQVMESVLEKGRTITHRLSIFAKKQTDEFSYGDIRSCLHDVSALLCIELGKREIKLEISDECHLDKLSINLSQSVLEHSVFNLVTNAMHAIGQNGIINIKVFLSEEGFVDLQVSDNGKGLGENEQQVLFTPFFTTKGPLGGSADPGSGLGLFYTYSAVRSGGGDIFVESLKNKGTSFTLRLKLLSSAE